MNVVKEGIKICDKEGLCFGDYSVKTKTKVSDFHYNGDTYKVKTHDELTRLERNDKLLFESIPGTTVFNFLYNTDNVDFRVVGLGNVQMSLELEPDTLYTIFIDDQKSGEMKTGTFGKISFSADLNGEIHKVKLEKN